MRIASDRPHITVMVAQVRPLSWAPPIMLRSGYPRDHGAFAYRDR